MTPSNTVLALHIDPPFRGHSAPESLASGKESASRLQSDAACWRNHGFALDARPPCQNPPPPRRRSRRTHARGAGRPARAVRRQRLRGADLSSRVVRAAVARDRLVGAVARRAARDVHGRLGSRQLAREPRRRGAIRRCAVTRCIELAIGVLGVVTLRGHSAARRRVRGARRRRRVDARRSGSSSRRSRCCRPRCSWAQRCPSSRRGSRSDARGAAWLGWCYAANTAGGVLGLRRRGLLSAARPRRSTSRPSSPSR